MRIARHPLILLVHDYFGHLPWPETYAESLARLGFRVVIPDLSSGVATVNAGVIESLMSQLDVAESDEWEYGADPESFIGRLKDHGTPVIDRSYSATSHSFANASVPAGFSAAAAAFAHASTAAFPESELAD